MTVILRFPVGSSSHIFVRALRRASRNSVGLVRSCGPVLMVGLVLTTTMGVEVPQLRSQAGATPTLSDARAKKLAAFFKAFHCPAPHYVEDYIQAADRYGLDYRLLPAISVRETTCGLTAANNNRWGYHPGRQSFPSVRAGIDFLTRQLAIKPPYAGKKVKEKLWTYNPRDAYPEEVQRLM